MVHAVHHTLCVLCICFSRVQRTLNYPLCFFLHLTTISLVASVVAIETRNKSIRSRRGIGHPTK